MVDTALCNRCKVNRGADRGAALDSGGRVIVNGANDQAVPMVADGVVVQVHS